MNRLKEIRLDNDLTLLDLAKLTDISPSDISQMENQKKYPFPGWRKKLAKALGEKENYIFLFDAWIFSKV